MAVTKTPRITLSIIRRYGGVVVVDGARFTTPHGRRLRTESVRRLIRMGRLVSSQDGLLGSSPQTYRMIG